MFIKQEYKIYAYYICAEEKLLSLIFAHTVLRLNYICNYI